MPTDDGRVGGLQQPAGTGANNSQQAGSFDDAIHQPLMPRRRRIPTRQEGRGVGCDSHGLRVAQSATGAEDAKAACSRVGGLYLDADQTGGGDGRAHCASGAAMAAEQAKDGKGAGERTAGGIELRPRPAAPSSRSCVLLVLDGEYLPRSQSPPIAEADRARGRRHGSNHLRSSNGLVISGCHRACMCQQHTDYCSRRRQRERNEEERETWYCAVVPAKATRTGRQRERGDGAGYFEGPGRTAAPPPCADGCGRRAGTPVPKGSFYRRAPCQWTHSC